MVRWALTELTSAPPSQELETSPGSGESLVVLRSEQAKLSLACWRGHRSPERCLSVPRRMTFSAPFWHHPGRMNSQSDFWKRQDAEGPLRLNYNQTNPQQSPRRPKCLTKDGRAGHLCLQCLRHPRASSPSPDSRAASDRPSA